MLESIMKAAAPRLIWFQEDGVGYLAGDPTGIYDADYFDQYARLDGSPIARALNQFRVSLVLRHAYPGCHRLLDIGIGDGAFLRGMMAAGWCRAGELRGTDINPVAIDYLKTRGQWGELEEGADIVTLWDAIEHFPDPRMALRPAAKVAMVSLPIFEGVEHVLASRHFKPDEHLWYWTRAGFIAFADRQGFEVVDILATETAIGRDGIETFVLRRRPTDSANRGSGLCG